MLRDAGGSILIDDMPSHSMTFKSPADCFEVRPGLYVNALHH